MPKINTSALPRHAPVTETKTLTDPLLPGEELTLTFVSRPDYGEALKVQALSEKHIKEFSGPGKVPIQVGGEDVEIVPNLCIVIAIVQTLEQPQEDGSGRYSFEDWARLSVAMPNAFGEAVEWAKEVMGKATSPQQEKDGSVEIPLD